MSALADRIKALEKGGFSQAEIDEWVASQRTKLTGAGFTRSEIDKSLGIPAPNEKATRSFWDNAAAVVKGQAEGLQAAVEGAAESVQQEPNEPSLLELFDTGYGGSATGLMSRGALPAQLPEDLSLIGDLAAQAGGLVGDFPFMALGAFLGAPAGTAIAGPGPGTAAGALGGAFGLPAMLREGLMQEYRDGTVTSFSEYWDRVLKIGIETTKGIATGVATGAAGGLQTGLMSKLGAEITTLVTVGKGLEGEVPEPRDFAEAAIVLGGLKAAAGTPRAAKFTAERLRNLYAKKGVPPTQVIQDAARDPSIVEDLNSTNNQVPRAYGGGGKPPATVPPKPATAEAPPPPPRSDAVKTVLSRISVGEKSKASYTWRDFYRDQVDRLDPLNTAVKAMAEGKKLATIEDAYKQARLLPGVSGKAEHFLRYAPFQFRTYKNVGRSMEDILTKAPDGKARNVDLNELRAYATAKRSLEKEAQGVKTGIPQDAAKGAVAELGGKYEPIFRELVEYQNSLSRYLLDAEILSQKAYDAMLEANKDFTPFYRVFEEAQPSGAGGRKMSARQPIRGMKGSERKIVDPLESIIRNTYLYVTLAEKNAIAETFIKQVEGSPRGAEFATRSKEPAVPIKLTDREIRKMTKETATEGAELVPPEVATIFRQLARPTARDEIALFRKGKREVWKLEPELAETFNALNVEQANFLVQMLATPAKLLRAGAIFSPEFIARNPVRDQLSAFIFSRAGFVPVYDFARGVYALTRKTEGYRDWLKSGGPMASLVSLDRNYLQKNVRQLAHQTNFMDAARNVVKSPIEMLRIISDTAERATRIREFERVTKGARHREAIESGGFASREVTLDFGRIGAKAQAMNMITAFWNAWVQGQDKTIRSFKEKPVATSAKVFAGVTIPSILLHLHNRDDPEYKQLPDWQRTLFWNFKVNGTWWRVPKPFELGIIFGTGAEIMTDQILDKDPRAFDRVLTALGTAFIPNAVPTFAAPLIETYANKNLFTGAAIVPAARERLLPEDQYKPYTTELAKKVGSAVATLPGAKHSRAASPAILENWVRGWTGGLGQHAIDLVDFALRKAGKLPDPPKPADTLADVPFVKAFVVRFPSGSAEPISRFYERWGEQQEVINSIEARAKDDDFEGVQRELAISGKQLFDVRAFHEALRNSARFVRLIEKAPGMKPEEKRQLIDEQYRMMIDAAEQGNAILDELEKVTEQK